MMRQFLSQSVDSCDRNEINTIPWFNLIQTLLKEVPDTTENSYHRKKIKEDDMLGKGMKFM